MGPDGHGFEAPGVGLPPMHDPVIRQIANRAAKCGKFPANSWGATITFVFRFLYENLLLHLRENSAYAHFKISGGFQFLTKSPLSIDLIILQMFGSCRKTCITSCGAYGVLLRDCLELD